MLSRPKSYLDAFEDSYELADQLWQMKAEADQQGRHYDACYLAECSVHIRGLYDAARTAHVAHVSLAASRPDETPYQEKTPQQDKGETSSGRPVLSTGEVCQRLRVQVSVSQLLAFGITPANQTKVGCYWFVADMPSIRNAVAAHVLQVVPDEQALAELRDHGEAAPWSKR